VLIMGAKDEHYRAEALRSVRISAGVERIRKDSGAFFALVAAAPDRATLERWIVDRFAVDAEVASISLEQTVRSMMPRPS